MSPDARVHRSAAVGFSRAVEDYERGRPGFPAAAIAFLRDDLGLAPGRFLLELGSGTGKLTRLLAPSGARIVAIEPVVAMREALARNVPDVEIVDAVAESPPLEDGSVDAAVAAQAFHWFDGERALVELARVLRPQGRIALVWNVRDETVPWIAEVTELIEPYRGDTPEPSVPAMEARLRVDTGVHPADVDVLPVRSRDHAGRRRRPRAVDQLHRGARRR